MYNVAIKFYGLNRIADKSLIEMFLHAYPKVGWISVLFFSPVSSSIIILEENFVRRWVKEYVYIKIYWP